MLKHDFFKGVNIIPTQNMTNMVKEVVFEEKPAGTKLDTQK